MDMDVITNIAQKVIEIGKRGIEAAVIGMLILGLLNCFLGFKLLKIWVSILGFAAGAGIGFGVVKTFVIDNVYGAGAAAVVLGILVSLLAYRIYLAGIFMVCWAAGSSLCYLLLRPNSSGVFFLCLMIGFGIGVLGVKFAGPVVIVTTGIQGGLSTGLALSAILNFNDVVMGIIMGTIAAILGVTFQFLTCRNELSQDEDENEDAAYQD